MALFFLGETIQTQTMNQIDSRCYKFSRKTIEVLKKWVDKEKEKEMKTLIAFIIIRNIDFTRVIKV